jgi:hypothetical protein
MRLAVLTLVALVVGFAQAPAKADPYQWCAVYGVDDGGFTNCYFLTLQQCQASVSGVGGFCARNNFFDGRPVTTDGSARRSKKRELH